MAFRWRTVHRLSWQRLLAAAVAVLLIPVATEIDAIATLTLLVAVLQSALIAYEHIRFAVVRERLRHGREAGPHGPASRASRRGCRRARAAVRPEIAPDEQLPMIAPMMPPKSNLSVSPMPMAANRK